MKYKRVVLMKFVGVVAPFTGAWIEILKLR